MPSEKETKEKGILDSRLAEKETTNSFVEETRNASEMMHEPWLEEGKELGFLTVPKDLSIIGGETRKKLLWIRILYEWAPKIRIRYPVVIFDYFRDEYLAGTIKATGYDLENPYAYERSASRYKLSLTSELIENNDLEFLENLPVFGVEPICSLRNSNGRIAKGSVSFIPHVRAPVFIPPEHIIHKIYDLPNEGLPYGVMLIGKEKAQDPKTGKYIGYHMRPELLFEHELVLGTTGKGKTVKCKNDTRNFIDTTGGAVIILDMHNEYSMINQKPSQSQKKQIKASERKIWEDLGIEGKRVENLTTWRMAQKGRDQGKRKNEEFFTIKFSNISPASLQYYLPALSPQGYVVLPKLVRKFRKSMYKDSLRGFYNWLKDTRLNSNLVSEMTKNALLRRISPIVEQGIFDVSNKRIIAPKELLTPGKVSVFRLDKIRNPTVERILVFHIINTIASVKLRDYKSQFPPSMILVDEAHNFFPRQVHEKREKDFVYRAINWIERVAKEGRKFKLRLELSTQSPEDLHPSVIKTVNTITFFGCTSVQADNLKRVMDIPIEKSELTTLPSREAIVFSRENASLPIKVLIPWPLVAHPLSKRVHK